MCFVKSILFGCIDNRLKKLISYNYSVAIIISLVDWLKMNYIHVLQDSIGIFILEFSFSRGAKNRTCFIHSALKYYRNDLPSKSPSSIFDMRFSCISSFFNNSNEFNASVGIFVSSFPPKLSLLSLRLKTARLKTELW